MRRLSISGMLILVVLFAAVFALIARLRAEASFYITGPIAGAVLAAWAYRRDGLALVTGGIIGGLCQGIFVVLLLKRGYIFPDIAMITGPLFLATLAAHMIAGGVFGTLLHLAFRWTRPQSTLR